MNIKVRFRPLLRLLLTALLFTAVAFNVLPGSCSAQAEEKANKKRPTVLLILMSSVSTMPARWRKPRYWTG